MLTNLASDLVSIFLTIIVSITAQNGIEVQIPESCPIDKFVYLQSSSPDENERPAELRIDTFEVCGPESIETQVFQYQRSPETLNVYIDGEFAGQFEIDLEENELDLLYLPISFSVNLEDVNDEPDELR